MRFVIQRVTEASVMVDGQGLGEMKGIFGTYWCWKKTVPRRKTDRLVKR